MVGPGRAGGSLAREQVRSEYLAWAEAGGGDRDVVGAFMEDAVAAAAGKISAAQVLRSEKVGGRGGGVGVGVGGGGGAVCADGREGKWSERAERGGEKAQRDVGRKNQ